MSLLPLALLALAIAAEKKGPEPPVAAPPVPEATVLIDAPRALVWQTLVEPEHAHVWNERGIEIDLEPGGGSITFPRGETLVGMRVLTYDPGRLLAHTLPEPSSSEKPEGAPPFHVLLTLEDEPAEDGAARTRVRARHFGLGEGEVWTLIRAAIARSGGKLTRFEEYCEKRHQAGEVAPEIDRSTIRSHAVELDAPVDVAWRLFTEDDLLERWMVPAARAEVRVGGALRTSYDPAGDLDGPDAILHHYDAVDPGRLLASHLDAPASAPAPIQALERTWGTVWFTPLEGGRSRVEMRTLGLDDTVTERIPPAVLDRAHEAAAGRLRALAREVAAEGAGSPDPGNGSGESDG